MLKKLVKQRKRYIPLAKKNFKKQENIKRKREAGNILWEVFGQNGKRGGGGISAVYFKDNFSHNIP